MTTDEFIELTKDLEKIKIDLGCGPNKREGFLGVDSLNLPGVDIKADLEKGLKFIPDNSLDEVSSSHFLEHIDKLQLILDEIFRVLKPGGVHTAKVPHFSNPYYYSDPTHKRFFGLYTFDYLSVDDKRYKRKVPGFYQEPLFIMQSRVLNFKSVFFLRNICKQFFKKAFNLSPYFQELYEEVFSGYISCSEIIFVMKANKKDS